LSQRPHSININDVVERLKNARRILITTHARADGDAIGSLLAMRRGLAAAGKDAMAFLHESVLPRYQFLTESEPFSLWDARTAAAKISDCDLLLIVDTCTRGQLGDVGQLLADSAKPSLAIDHHTTRDDVVAECWVDSDASACSQMIVELFASAGWSLDEKTATLLFCGMATDTGWFRFSNADQRAYATAAQLIAAGVRPNELYEKLFLNERPERARLIGEIMSTFQLHAGGRLAVIKVTQDMLRRSGANPQMTEDLINEPQRIASVIACVMIAEPAGDEPVRVSFRSKRDIDVAAIAGQFGGGGHARAAGAKLKGAFEPSCLRVIEAMIKAIEG
jgi:phosphoesterase RecJ-like protein